MVLLDYSAAFDTINHDMLIQRFSHTYGIEGSALKWLKSYLENRKQIVIVNGAKSDEFPLTWGVSQGSVMGPLEFVFISIPSRSFWEINRPARILYYMTYGKILDIFLQFSLPLKIEIENNILNRDMRRRKHFLYIPCKTMPLLEKKPPSL